VNVMNMNGPFMVPRSPTAHRRIFDLNRVQFKRFPCRQASARVMEWTDHAPMFFWCSQRNVL